MTKKKTSSKQTKANMQKPAAKPAKQDAAPKKDASEKKKDAGSKSTAAQSPQAKAKKPEQLESRTTKTETSAKVTAKNAEPVAAKSEPAESKPESNLPQPKSATAQPKESKKSSPPEIVESKKKEDSKPSGKGGQKGGKKKNKEPRQSAENRPSVVDVAVESGSEPGLSPTVDDSAEAQAAISPVESPIEPDVPVAAEHVEPTDAPTGDGEHKRKVAKTLIDEEVNVSSQNEPKNVAETMLEINVGGLKEVAAKATGTSAKAEEPQRKVPKTLLEISTDGLRDAVEASSRAIEDEIAAAIKESESKSDGLRDSVEATALAIEDEIAEAIRESEENEKASAPTQPKAADRKVAKTMLDFRAEEFFELANLDTDQPEDAQSQPSVEPAVDTAAKEPAAAVPDAQPRKIAKTMLEIDISRIDVLAESANASAQVPEAGNFERSEHGSGQMPAEAPVLAEIAPEPPRDLSAGYDDVSMDDLNEFAQALRDNTAMSPPSTRAERLRKTMLGIRKHGLSSSPSLPGVGLTAESQLPSVAEPQPVRVSRSLHPLDNFSFDNLCPADDDGSAEPQAESLPPQHDVLADSAPSLGSEGDHPGSTDLESPAGAAEQGKRNTGTVELAHSPHQESAEGEFKGVTTVWPHDKENPEQDAEAKQGSVKPERFVPKTMLDMDFLKESLSASVSRAEERLAESLAQKASVPPKQLLTSDDFKIASPNCPFVWADNPDNPKERVKYCTECSAQIYNLTGFDMSESQSLIFKRENRNNATLYKREDGKFMTTDCPIALKKKKDKQMLIGGAALVLVLLVIMMVASFLAPQPTKTNVESPSDASDSSSDSNSASPKAAPTKEEQGSNKTGDKEPPGTFHYKKGKVVQPQQPAPTIVVPDDNANTTIPGTNSGYDEGGKFWQYTDKGNN